MHISSGVRRQIPDCLLEQVVEHAAIQNINAFIEAGLATAGTDRK
jgi:hypothetical protein